MRNVSGRQEQHWTRARASLRQAIARYTYPNRQDGGTPPPPDSRWQAAVQPELDLLQNLLTKLEQGLVRIAAFGLVSRGKSALLNALMGQKVFETGPLNGVTQWPRSVRWLPSGGSKIQVELIDTPGLDEVAGETRAEMAREITRQADLILFVVSGDITRTEYRALCDLRAAQKPIILVFNKVDLYPDQDRQAIEAQLQRLSTEAAQRLDSLLSVLEIVRVSAEPPPLPVRVEWPDGRVTHEWEALPPDIVELQQAILRLLNREGRSLIALNAMVQARAAETAIAQKTLELRSPDAEALIWRYVRYKSLAVALNPIALLDVVGGAIADLALIRALARLYGLPITRYEASKIWRTLMLSSGGLLLGELASSALWGLGKSAAAATSVLESPGNLAGYTGAALTQGAIAGYGTYAIGRAAQMYLEQGCSWGPQGASTLIQDILQQVEPNTILARLRQELEAELQPSENEEPDWI